MKNLRQDHIPPVLHEQAAVLPIARICCLVAVVLTACFLPAARAADPYSDALDKQFSGLDSAVAKQVQEMAQAREAEEAPPAESANPLWQIAGVVAGIAALRIALLILGGRTGPNKPAGRASPGRPERRPGGQPSTTMSGTATVGQIEATPPEPGQPPSDAQAEHSASPTAGFLKFVSMELTDQQRLLLAAARSNDAMARQTMLLEVSERLRYLCYSSRHPELRPVLQIAVCLEKLLKKLAQSSSAVTNSELRTIAGGLEVMHDLCSLGEGFRLGSDNAGRILVVDDDAVSRFAVSAALKDAVNKPDLASDGATGLSLAEGQAYDAIFLDVEMPGMDGFELCAKIHQTSLNPTTPVVFVTQHSDFESRSKAAELGGHDLIGKPFLPLEVTAKALTLILRSQLQRHEQNLEGTEGARDKGHPGALGSKESLLHFQEGLRSKAAQAAQTPQNVTLAGVSALGSGEARARREIPFTAPSFSRGAAQDKTREQNSGKSEADSEPKTAPNDYAAALYRIGPAHLQELMGRLQAAVETSESTARGELLSEIYIGIHTLVSEARRAELSAFQRLGSALEALVRKLLDRADSCVPSAFESMSAGLSLLEELCRSKVEPVVDEPPIRILVVDDDPIARRAVASAVQLIFGRPATADSGEAAIAAASESPFDLILLDVLMPGMDGFTTCSMIKQTALNEDVPVLFVTSQSDAESRRQAAAAGACGFIPKPFFPAELTVKVLTFVLRGRLGQLMSSSR